MREDMPTNYAEVFNSIPIPATLIDARGIIVDINQAFLQLTQAYGLPIRKEDRIGRHIAAFARSTEETSRFSRFIDDLLSTGKSRHLEWSYATETGEWIWWDIDAQAIKDSDGRLTGARFLIRGFWRLGSTEAVDSTDKIELDSIAFHLDRTTFFQRLPFTQKEEKWTHSKPSTPDAASASTRTNQCLRNWSKRSSARP